MTSSSIENKNQYKDIFKELKCCVIIPTYNNATTLKSVITDVSEYTDDVIVFNDGSTDNTYEILQSISGIQVLNEKPNRGKGLALRKGFKYAFETGYLYAITIDSDGQHFAKDLPLFLEKLNEEKNAIIIGARNMEQESVPGKSSFGHKFSNFWFKFETGIEALDTQSGYRLYPLLPLSKINFYTVKYEFEIEVIVRAAWKGINICFVPVSVYYAPADERISHFRPFKDFSRVSVLNTVLVIFALLYYIPLRLFNNLKKKSLKQLIKDNILDGKESNLHKSLSIAFGVFMGIIPIWGWQIISSIALAHILKLNKVIVVLASNISILPLMPIILFLSFKTGQYMLGCKGVEFNTQLTTEAIKQNFFQYLIGSIGFAIIAALFFGFLSYLLLYLFRKKKLEKI